jgi:predicted transcriptional regulator
MSQTVTLTLPDKLYGPIQRIAEATDTTVEAVLLTALQASLPSLEGLSSELAQELFELEALDNEALRQVILETVPLDQQQELDSLLQQNQAGKLTKTETEQLAYLQSAADRIMLRKARAAVLLRFRGQRIPTVAELHQLTIAAS